MVRVTDAMDEYKADIKTDLQNSDNLKPKIVSWDIIRNIANSLTSGLDLAAQRNPKESVDLKQAHMETLSDWATREFEREKGTKAKWLPIGKDAGFHALNEEDAKRLYFKSFNSESELTATKQENGEWKLEYSPPTGKDPEYSINYQGRYLKMFNEPDLVKNISEEYVFKHGAGEEFEIDYTYLEQQIEYGNIDNTQLTALMEDMHHENITSDVVTLAAERSMNLDSLIRRMPVENINTHLLDHLQTHGYDQHFDSLAGIITQKELEGSFGGSFIEMVAARNNPEQLQEAIDKIPNPECPEDDVIFAVEKYGNKKQLSDMANKIEHLGNTDVEKESKIRTLANLGMSKQLARLAPTAALDRFRQTASDGGGVVTNIVAAENPDILWEVIHKLDDNLINDTVLSSADRVFDDNKFLQVVDRAKPSQEMTRLLAKRGLSKAPPTTQDKAADGAIVEGSKGLEGKSAGKGA